MTTTVEKLEENRKTVLVLYIVFAFSMILQLTAVTSTTGILTGTIAIITAYIKRRANKGTAFESHIQWLIRTFWIGGGLLLPIATVIAALTIYYMGDMTSLYNAISSAPPGDISSFLRAFELFYQDNFTLIVLTTIVTLGPVIVWSVWRCWFGFKLAKESKPIENPTSWLK